MRESGHVRHLGLLTVVLLNAFKKGIPSRPPGVWRNAGAMQEGRGPGTLIGQTGQTRSPGGIRALILLQHSTGLGLLGGLTVVMAASS